MENTQELLQIVGVDESFLTCGANVNECIYKERTLSYAQGVEIAPPGIIPEIQFKECCYVHLVFGDANSNDSEKNDYSGFYHNRKVNNENVDFILYKYSNDTEYLLNDNTYGQFFDFGDLPPNGDLKGYKIEWKKVLSELGAGSYKIITRRNVAGIDIETESFVFTLKQYSTLYADNTVRVDVLMNGYLRKSDVDFTDVNWSHSIRIPGYFGDREPQFEEDNLIDTDFESEQITISQTNEYYFQTNLLPECVTTEIWDFILLSNDIYMTDYNLNNHSYNYVKFGVKFSGNEGSIYPIRSRKARLNLLFKDKFLDNRKENFY